MASRFTDKEKEQLAAPHVCRAWFAALDLPSGMAYLHSGTGRVALDGLEWRGVTDPIGGRLLSIGTVEEPQFGQAASLTLMLTGCDAAFLRSVYASRAALEGRSAEVWWVAFDPETQEVLIPRKRMFPRGRITSPKISWSGIGTRTVQITVENIFSAQNYAPGGRWNPADQKRRFPGDLGLDFVGVDIVEYWS